MLWRDGRRFRLKPTSPALSRGRNEIRARSAAHRQSSRRQPNRIGRVARARRDPRGRFLLAPSSDLTRTSIAGMLRGHIHEAKGLAILDYRPMLAIDAPNPPKGD